MEIIATISGVIKLLNTLVDVFKKLAKISAEKELNEWLENLDSTLKKVESAQSLQERVNAAKALADLVRRMG